MTAPLEVRDIAVRFGGRVALDGVSFSVDANEVVGVIGPNGAGKSTLFDAICGLNRLERGVVILGGQDVTSLSPHDRARQGLGRSFQDGRLFPSLTVEEAVAIALQRHLPVEAPVSMMLSGPLSRSRRRKVADRVEAVLDLMGLGLYAEAYVRELSTGTRRLVDLACAVAHDPDVLLLDEPTSGIAQAEVAQMPSLLERVRRQIGCAVVLIEHDIPLVTTVSDRLIALETGRVIAEGKPQDVIDHPDVLAAYLGTEHALAKELA